MYLCSNNESYYLMKKNYLLYTIIFMVYCSTVNAQLITLDRVKIDPCILPSSVVPSWTGQSQKLFSRCADVKVGIGTDNPTHSIHTPYDARFGQTRVDFNQGIGAEPRNFSKLYIKNLNQDAAIEIDQSGNNKVYQKLLVFSYTHPTTEILKAYNSETGLVSHLFDASGKTTISNGTQKIFQLSTNGLLRVRNVRIDTEVWPDYVFNPTYQLMPLLEVEQFVRNKGHLPNIPSEEEIIRDGMDVADMNVKLLEKVEELTLYLIEQEKKIQLLQKEIDLLKK